MANKEIWVGGTAANAAITSIKDATRINKYIFYTTDSNITGTGSLDTSTSTLGCTTAVNKSVTDTILVYLLYTTKTDGTNYDKSNVATATLLVKQPLNTTSCSSFNVDSDLWVWSNTTSKDFTSTIALSTSTAPYIYNTTSGSVVSHTIKSSQITTSAVEGSVLSITDDSTTLTNTLSWKKTTGSTTDLGAATKTITFTLLSISGKSAETGATVRTASNVLTIRNAVTSLTGGDITLYQSSTSGNTKTITVAPTNAYSKTITLVGETSDTAPSSVNGCSLSLSGQTITFTCSKPTTKSTTTTIKCRVKSTLGATDVYSSVMTFTATGVTALTGKNMYEGKSLIIDDCGIGTISSASVTTPTSNVPCTVTKSGTGITITGNAVTSDTTYTITVTNANGATNTISGTIQAYAQTTIDINTGDTIGITLPEAYSGTAPTSSYGTLSLTTGSKSATFHGTKAGTETIQIPTSGGGTMPLKITITDIGASLT